MTNDEWASLARWARDPDLRQAGDRYEAELRAEAAEYELLAAKDRLRGRDLADVAGELVARGDVVTISLSSRSFTGEVVHAAGDLACLATAGGEVDVHLGAPLAISVVERVHAGGRSRAGGPGSFAARLAEHEAAGSRVELGARLSAGAQPAGWERIARVEAVARDHVVVTVDGQPSFVALAAVDYVRLR